MKKNIISQSIGALGAREKAGAVAAAIALCIGALHLGVWRPSLSTLSKAPAQLRQLDGQMEELSILAAKARGRSAQAATAPSKGQALAAPSSISKKASSAAASPADETFEASLASGQELASFIQERRYGLGQRVKEARLARQPAGLWSGTLTFETIGVEP